MALSLTTTCAACKALRSAHKLGSIGVRGVDFWGPRDWPMCSLEHATAERARNKARSPLVGVGRGNGHASLRSTATAATAEREVTE